jgi:hypothetical protein
MSKCDTKNSVCEQAGVSSMAHATCGASCVDASKCMPLTAVNQSMPALGVCLTNVASSQCSSIACASLIVGWSTTTAQCMRYADSVSAGGYCEADASCATNAAQRCATLVSPSLTPVVVSSCSPECRKQVRKYFRERESEIEYCSIHLCVVIDQGSCAAGSDATSITFRDLCFVNQTSAVCTTVSCKTLVAVSIYGLHTCLSLCA